MWEGLRLLESSLQDLAKPGKVQDLAKVAKQSVGRMSEHLQPALLLFSCFQTTANNLYLYLCTYLYQSLNPYLYDGRVSIRRRWSSPAFQPERPT